MAAKKSGNPIKNKPNEESERVVKQHLKRCLQFYGRSVNLPVRVDWPAASEYGVAGRPDAYVDIGPYHLRIEVKKKGKTADARQVEWVVQDQHHVFGRCLLVCGKEGVDKFMAVLPEYLGHLANQAVIDMKVTRAVLADEGGMMPGDWVPTNSGLMTTVYR